MRRTELASLAVVVAIVLLAYAGWPFRVRWQDAYQALEAPEITGASAERERLRLALAAVESEPPPGWTAGPRLHRPGSLAELRYRTYDVDGRHSAQWHVRALVPPLPAQPEDALDESAPLRGSAWCSAACRAEVTRAGATLLLRSGETGIAAEWVLRMPLGREFDLGPRPLATQDVLDETKRAVAMVSTRRGDRTVTEPAQLRVTLVDICAAEVQRGALTQVEFFPHAIVPIPRGLRTLRWVQLNGCGALQPMTPMLVEAAAPAAEDRALEAGVAASFFLLRRDGANGTVTLQVDEARLSRMVHPVGFRLGLLCRYEPTAGQWQRVRGHALGIEPWFEPRADVPAEPARIALALPADASLYWLRWFEPEARTGSQPPGPADRVAHRHQALALVGRVWCNDVHLGSPLAGHIATCVPFANHAEARFVPDPAAACEHAP